MHLRWSLSASLDCRHRRDISKTCIFQVCKHPSLSEGSNLSNPWLFKVGSPCKHSCCMDQADRFAGRHPGTAARVGLCQPGGGVPLEEGSCGGGASFARRQEGGHGPVSGEGERGVPDRICYKRGSLCPEKQPFRSPPPFFTLQCQAYWTLLPRKFAQTSTFERLQIVYESAIGKRGV